MEIRKETFDIITLEAGEKEYYPSQESLDSMKEYMEEEELKTKCVFNEMEIPKGHSRYGGCVIDIPKNTNFPIAKEEFDHPTYNISQDGFGANYLRFAAQLDLTQIGHLDKTGLLPTTGQLYFFADIYNNKCKVVYIDVKSDELERLIVQHEDNFFIGRLIEGFKAETESFEDHLRLLNEDEDELECYDCGEDFRTCDCNSEHNMFKKEDITKDGKIWDEFAGGEKSKIFGIFSHCQWSKSDIEEMTFSDKIILLQIGENDFNDEGVFCVSIKRKDLEDLNFDNCECYWAQT